MTVFIIFVILFVVTNAALTDRKLWSEFKGNHSKTYNVAEDKLRFRVFQNNLRKIETHNAQYEKGEISYFLTTTPYTDWTAQEFQTLLKSQAGSKPSYNYTEKLVIDPNFVRAGSVDWRNANAVTGVKNQGQCGSCWSFCVTGGLEGQMGIHKNQLVALSEQELISCSAKNSGCNGGNIQLGYEYVSYYGLSSEDQYPYTGSNGQCWNIPNKVLGKIYGYGMVDHNEPTLEYAVAKVGPISVAVEANNNWQFYGGGVFNDPGCGNGLNHGVLVVGYVDNYWIIKNSWGGGWGEGGYMRLIRGMNQCGISNDPSFPVL